MNLPTVTIGLPVYNGDRYLEEAIESALSQTYADLEVVIADNASTDSTEEICRHFESVDSRVQYWRNETNLGAARNYNLTLERARGRYFKWLAHDDVCKPDFVRVCVEALDADPDVVLAYPTPVDIDENGIVLGLQDAGLGLDDPDPVQRFRDTLDQPHTALPVFGLTRTDVLRHTGQHGNFPAADRVLLAELALWGKLYEVPQELYLHREHDQRFVHTHQSDRDRVAWFDPSRKGEVFFTQWRELREHVNAVRRAPLTDRQRMSLQVYLGKWMIAKRRNLAGELKAGALLRIRGPSE